MYVLITCKFKKYWIISNRKKVETSIFRHYGAANSLVSRQIWPKFKPIQALIHVLITCKYQKDRIKTTKKQWRHHFPHYKSMGVFFKLSRADNSIVGGPIWPKFQLLLDIMHVPDTYKIKMDRINSYREKVATSIFLTLKGSKLCSPRSDLAKFRTHPSSYVCHL